MEALYYVLGILTALIIVGGIFSFKMWRKITAITKDIDSLWESFDSLADDFIEEINDVHSRINTELESTLADYNAAQINLGDEAEEIYRSISLRLEKELSERIYEMLNKR